MNDLKNLTNLISANSKYAPTFAIVARIPPLKIYKSVLQLENENKED